jgi:hypothetical protein
LVLRKIPGGSGVSTDVSQAAIVGDEAMSVVVPPEKEMMLKRSVMVIALKRPRGGAAAVYVVNIARYKPPRARHAVLKSILLNFQLG